MSNHFNPNRKNQAFLAQFLTETLYKIPEESPQEKKISEENFNQSRDEADEHVDTKNEVNESSDIYAEQSEIEQEQSDVTEPPSQHEEQSEVEKEANSLDTETKQSQQELLVDQDLSGQEKTVEDHQTQNKIDYYGQFQQSILILVNYPNQKNLITKDKLVLKRIFQALALNLESSAIINIQKEQLTWQDLRDNLTFNCCLAFGVDTDFFPFNLQEYEVTETEEGIKMLLAAPVERIAASKTDKKQLWQNLKTLFNKD